MQAPLGWAVIGGLLMSTVATLLVVPAIFALLIGGRQARSPSVHPYDPESPHYDPEAVARGLKRDAIAGALAGRDRLPGSQHEEATAEPGDDPAAGPEPRRPTAGPAVAFLAGGPPGRRRWLSQAARSRRGPERRRAAARAAHPADDPEDRPRRRAAELHRKLRAYLDLSQAHGLYRPVERRHRRHRQEGPAAGHPVRSRAGRGFWHQEGDSQAGRGAWTWPRRWWTWPTPT